jgi:gamma-glutamyltranspeptidase
VGGILSEADLAAYSATWAEPVMLTLTASNLTMYSVPPPGSGAVLAAILNIIQHSDNFQVCKGHTERDRQQPDHVQRIAARQRGRPGGHTQHHPTFRQLPGM